MHVVLEGPDNAGKSTLAKAIRTECNRVTYYHPGGAPSDAHDEEVCLTTQRNFFESSGQFLFDRVTCISQQVYNPNPSADEARKAFAQHMVRRPNMVVVYCRPPNETLMDVGNYTWRAEETEEHRQKIITRAAEFIARYDEVMLQVPTIFYDWKDEVHASLIVRKLVQALNGREDAVRWFRDILEMRS